MHRLLTDTASDWITDEKDATSSEDSTGDLTLAITMEFDTALVNNQVDGNVFGEVIIKKS